MFFIGCFCNDDIATLKHAFISRIAVRFYFQCILSGLRDAKFFQSEISESTIQEDICISCILCVQQMFLELRVVGITLQYDLCLLLIYDAYIFVFNVNFAVSVHICTYNVRIIIICHTYYWFYFLNLIQ